MDFIADQQTLDDLNITGKYKPKSLFSFFNKVKTRGGERQLERMFHRPLTDPDEINLRAKTIKNLAQKELSFPFDRQQVELFEDYLDSSGAGRIGLVTDLLKRRAIAALISDAGFEFLVKSLWNMKFILTSAGDLLESVGEQTGLKSSVNIRAFLKSEAIKTFISADDHVFENLWQVIRFDQLLRYRYAGILLELKAVLRELDVYIAISGVSRKHGLKAAKALPREAQVFQARQLRYPTLKDAVGNDIRMDKDRNLIFLTGANMAGKSTLMKTIGASLYLAQMGFPVAAESFEFSVRDGICSSINVSDNLSMGYSHFYAEVLRVKSVAAEVASGKALLVIFDELFKGTNVKDAFDGTVEIVKAFGGHRRSMFVISTHITEVADQIAGPNVQFCYLPTLLRGVTPVYTYQLTQGVSEDRHGMVLINKERILETITGRNA